MHACAHSFVNEEHCLLALVFTFVRLYLKHIYTWCFVLGHSLLPVHSGGRLLLGSRVCDGCRELKYAYAILPRYKLERYLVCVEPRAISRRGCFLSCYLHVDKTQQPML